MTSGLLGVEEFTDALIKMLDAEFVDKLKAWLFISGLWRIPSWMIAADFVVDTRTPHKCMAFTIMPLGDLATMMRAIDHHLPKDIKKSSELDNASADWFRKIPAFHFILVLEKKYNSFGAKPGRKARVISVLDEAIERAKLNGRTKQHLKPLTILRHKMHANNFSFDLLSDINVLVGVLVVLEGILRKVTLCEGTFLAIDRDDMTTSYSSAFTMFLGEVRATLGERNGFNDHVYKFGIAGVSSKDTSKRAWFDSLIRIPDWIAGAVGSLNIRSTVPTPIHPKVVTMLNNVLGDAQNVSAILIEGRDPGMELFQIQLKRANISDAPSASRDADEILIAAVSDAAS